MHSPPLGGCGLPILPSSQSNFGAYSPLPPHVLKTEWGSTSRNDLIRFHSTEQHRAPDRGALRCACKHRVDEYPPRRSAAAVPPTSRHHDRYLNRGHGARLTWHHGIPFRYADPLADLGALVGRIAGIAVAAASLRLTRLAADS